jgi:hypothetical protein
MSALGQKQTFAVQNVMSALPPKADILRCRSDLRYGPEADIWGSWRSLMLFLKCCLVSGAASVGA